MKKYFMSLAALAMIVACGEKDPKPNGPNNSENGGDESGYVEKTFVYDFDFIHNVETTYGTKTLVADAEGILDFLELTEDEFYEGMGSLTSTGSLTSGQQNNTIMFGAANGNDTENGLTWCPSTTNNFGHYFTSEGVVTTWGEGGYMYAESLCEFGSEEPVYEDMFTFSLGFHPGNYKGNPGDTFSFTMVYFRTDENEKEYYAYVKVNCHIVEAEAVELVVVSEKTIEFTADYDGAYTAHDIDFSEAAAAVGAASIDDCEVYGVNADGSYSAVAGKNFWFDADMNIASWGDTATICINKDSGSWTWCMMPRTDLAGTVCRAKVAVAKDGKACIVEVVVNINAFADVAVVEENLKEEASVDVEITVDQANVKVSVADAVLNNLGLDATNFTLAQNTGLLSYVAAVAGENVETTAGGYVGNWFDAEGKSIKWGTTTEDEAKTPLFAYYVELRDGLVAGAGVNADIFSTIAGKTIETYSHVITFTYNEKEYKLTLNYKVTFASELPAAE